MMMMMMIIINNNKKKKKRNDIDRRIYLNLSKINSKRHRDEAFKPAATDVCLFHCLTSS